MFRRILCYCLSLLLLLATACRRSAPNTPPESPGGQTEAAPAGKAAPAYVWNVLKHVRQHDKAPAGYVGGRNFENREKILRAKTSAGKVVRYREWDVFPKMPGQNRGAERLVTGSDGSAYYTKNHYKSFQTLEAGREK